MASTFSFNFPLANGLHARPASFLAEVARRFASAISLQNGARGTVADVKSVLSMVAADVHRDDACILSCVGPDEDDACRTLSDYIKHTLESKDAPLPEMARASAELRIPRSLAAVATGPFLRGKPVCGGVAVATAIRVRGVKLPQKAHRSAGTSALAEQNAFHEALRALSRQIESRSAPLAGDEARDVMDVHRSLLGDPELIGRVEALLRSGEKSAAQAVLEVGQALIATLERSTSLYLRERVLDLQDVIMQLLVSLGEAIGGNEQIKLVRPSICIADHLTPSQFLAMDRTLLKGLVLGQAGTTSHTVILARSRGVPTLVDANEAIAQLRNEQEIALDAELGILIPTVTDPLRRYYQAEERRLDRMRQRDAQTLALPAAPVGGRPIEIAANVSSAEEVDDVCRAGADAVGLFRTEMLFMGARAPTEAEQFEAYSKAVQHARGKTVIIRTFDIGGDKPVPYLDLPKESNPFLGNRGVRLYPSHSSLVRSQLRALLRASVYGNLKIMVPMVSCVEEVRSFRSWIEAAHRELLSEGNTEITMPPLGIMIEVPAAAMIMPQLAREVDFFSIGSNDLTQYLLAADRDHPALGSLYDWRHPSLWTTLRHICDAARAAGKWVGLCGELGERAEAIPLLVALGLDEFSVPATRIAEFKRKVRSLDLPRCEDLLSRVVATSTQEEVEAVLRDGNARSSGEPMVTTGLIELSARAQSKEEAIKELADLLWLNDRASDPRQVEHDLWAREETYSTGFGYGCAIPHCKSAAVRANSVVLAKLPRPINWNNDAANPVDLILMIALREQDHGKEHMRVLSQLSRMLMRDEFRDSLRSLSEPEALLAFLNQSLNL